MIVRITRNRLFDMKNYSYEKIWGNSNEIVIVGCTQRWRWTKNHNRR